ncbi:Ger(x)C family spore germination protein [Halobacillus litoralis]|uniref:Ger(x)C family spore germination protein n=1 Tax=Halobacillus litoralis TaxID=45668 RepID=UPI001CD468AA|nr:Ger(x)C family spore germination protein [Halobacillus litoralis]MCA0969324.1 Ger(x)C family spore germination protein [Halobacillus litoralis]
MTSSWVRISLIIICLSLLSGCWNSNELDELGIAVSVAIDKNDEGDYLVAVQVINPSEIATDAPTNRPPVSTYSTTGETLLDAFRRLSAKSPRQIYFSQMRLVIIGSKLAEEGVMPSLDFLYRDHEFRTSFYVAVAKNAPAEVMLSIVTPYEKIPANKIMNSIDNVQKNWGVSKGVSIDKLIADVRDKGKSPVLPGIDLLGDPEVGNNMSNVENVDAPTKLEVDHLAAFKEDRLVGWLSEMESQGLNYATGDVRSTIVTHPCDDEGTISVEILRTQSSMKSKMDGSTPEVTIMVEAEGNVAEVDCKIDLGSPESIQEVNKEVEKQIEKTIQSSVTAAQEELESDFLGLGSAVHRDNPTYWKSVEDEWDQQFTELDVSIEVKAKIRRKGNSTQPINKEG